MSPEDQTEGKPVGHLLYFRIYGEGPDHVGEITPGQVALGSIRKQGEHCVL